MKRSLHIDLISGSGRPEMGVLTFLLTESLAIAASKAFDLTFSSTVGECMLPRARNRAIAHFLFNTTATDLLMIDDDNWADPGTLSRLMGHDVDVVGIPCRAKKAELQWPVRWFRDRPIKRSENGLIEVDGVGTGILKVSRGAIKAMAAARPDSWVIDDAFPDKKTPVIFEYDTKDHRWWGEDIIFCKRFQEVGGKVYVDPDVKTYHRGSVNFEGSVTDWLKVMPKTMTINEPIPVQNEFAV